MSSSSYSSPRSRSSSSSCDRLFLAAADDSPDLCIYSYYMYSDRLASHCQDSRLCLGKHTFHLQSSHLVLVEELFGITSGAATDIRLETKIEVQDRTVQFYSSRCASPLCPLFILYLMGFKHNRGLHGEYIIRDCCLGHDAALSLVTRARACARHTIPRQISRSCGDPYERGGDCKRCN